MMTAALMTPKVVRSHPAPDTESMPEPENLPRTQALPAPPSRLPHLSPGSDVSPNPPRSKKPRRTSVKPRPGRTGFWRRASLNLRGYWTVRTRVLGAVLALTCLGLVVAGTVAYSLQRNELNASIDDSLQRSFLEFEQLLNTGIDPDTREAFVEAEQLVYLVMQRTLTAPNEGMMGIRDGRVILQANPAVTTRIEQDATLVQHVANRPDDAGVAIETVETPTSTYRVLVVPVQLAADPMPTKFVHAYDVEAERGPLNRTFATFALISFGTLVFIGVVGWLLVGNLLKPIRLLRSTAQRISDSDLSQRIPVSGKDDLSELTRTVNAMLERLDGSFNSQRQLLDDVGHELRTPITIVQGHLELQDSADEKDVLAVRDVALDELERMRLLVDDLVTLAGIARPDFVRPEPVHVGRLTDEVLDKARSLGTRRWTIDARAEATCALDPRRITQAWLQLVVNAVKFSKEGSTIAVGSRIDGEGIKLWVRDEGIGVPKADQQRIFERFTRGTNGKRTEGSGLGLPIVSAITQAHGGEVELMSAPEQGSTFTMVIPPQTHNLIGEQDET